MRQFLALAILVSLVLVSVAFGQSSNASVGGFVQDSSQAIVPGVTITATNTQTGVVSSTITNESGTYTFPSLHIALPGTWSFDANMGKTFKIGESNGLQVRFDSTNIFNHPNPSAPSMSINSTNPLGYIANKGGQRREFKGQLRLTF